MLAVVKTPRTEFKVEGDIPDELLSWLNDRYDEMLEVAMDDDDVVENYFETELHRKSAALGTDGSRLATRRWNAGLTQAELAAKTGFTRHRISDMECGRRGISIAAARKLAAALGVTADKIIKL